MDNSIKLSTEFLGQVKEIIAQAYESANRSVDFYHFLIHLNIGNIILKEGQLGKESVEYESYLIKNLSKEHEPKYGTGFSIRQLERCIPFYKEYPIASVLRSQYFIPKENTTILASQYKLYLPSEEVLRQEMEKEIHDFEERVGIKKL